MRWAILATVLVVMLALIFVVAKQAVRPMATVAAVNNAYEAGDLREASELIGQLDERNLSASEQAEVAAITGHLARAENRFNDALAAYRRVPVGTSESHLDVAIARADLCEQLGRFTEAVDVLQQRLKVNEDDVQTRRRLANLFAMGGQRYRAWPHIQRLIEAGFLELDVLTAAADPRHVLFIPFEARKQISHGDPLLVIGTTRLHLRQGLEDDVRTYLDQLRQADGFAIERYILEGWISYQIDGLTELERWAAARPTDHNALDQVADYWYLMGLVSASRGEHAAAVRCYLESLVLWPDYSPAVSALAKSAAAIGELAMAQAAAKRASLLDELAAAASPLATKAGTCRDIETAARVCLELGRSVEAVGWCRHAASVKQCVDDSWIAEVTTRAKHVAEQPWLQSGMNLAKQFDRMRFPLPSSEYDTHEREQPQTASANEIAFRDDAADVGVQFQGFRDPNVEHTMRYFTGTGIGVVDFDADLLPDLFFSQNTEQSVDRAASTARDPTTSRLFRNLAGTRFFAATNQSYATAIGFGQGVAVGDVDGDGFQDIYLGNDGPNELFINNGDGTFRDASHQLGSDRATAWTSSVAIADIDADGVADLFDANYLSGEDIRIRVCGNEQRQISCPPRTFSPAPDELRLGAGTLSDESSFVTGQLDEPFGGNGLGVIVANLDDEPGLELFVANDVTPNHLFVRSPAGWSDEATFRGLAYDSDGASQACMGVACTDVNLDGSTDLFVTNFFNERNALYLSDRNGFYSEAIDQYRLGADSFSLLGFGAQFFDADADGDDDLIVANGHIFDAGDGRTPYRMQPKLYESRGEQFVAVPAQRAGAFFKTPQLGRAVARVDWNNDRATDVVMTDLKAPASLLTNVSPQLGRVLRVRLVGTKSHRDAIGAVVEVSTGGRRIRRELTAGDGYFCSNERVLTFASPQDTAPVSIKVRWPSGTTEWWAGIAPDSDALLIERGSEDRPALLP